MSITRDAVSAWLDAYIRAWDSYDPARIGALFSEDATYAYHPWDARPMRGREAIVAGWLSDRDAPGSWSARYEPVAIDGDTVVATGRSHYRETADHPAREYFNCFIMRFDEDGRCTDFMECYMLHPKPTAG